MSQKSKIISFFLVSMGFDFAKSLDKLENLQKQKLMDERYGLGNAKSDIVLIIPYTSSISEEDQNYCMNQLRRMREQIPGTYLNILCFFFFLRTLNYHYYHHHY